MTSVSAVIPVYNGERFLGEAIESVLAQSAPPAELIVVDDGSTDGSADLAGMYPGVRVHRLAHAGVSAARNAGGALSKGNCIAFLDADDFWHPRKLELQSSALERSPDAGIAWCRHTYRFEGPIPEWFRGPRDGGPAEGHLLTASLIRRSTWDLVGEFDTGLTHGEDGDWRARAIHLGVKMTYMDEPLMTYRIHDRNASGDAAGVREGILRAMRSSLRRNQAAKP